MQKPQSNTYIEESFVKIEGPHHIGEQWEMDITIGPKHMKIYGNSQAEMQAQIDQYITQQVEELEKSRSRLKEILGKPKKDPWPNTNEC